MTAFSDWASSFASSIVGCYSAERPADANDARTTKVAEVAGGTEGDNRTRLLSGFDVVSGCCDSDCGEVHSHNGLDDAHDGSM